MLVEVALPVPVPRTFAYHAETSVAPGTRVRVTFSGRRLVGWVVGPAEPRHLERVRPIERVLETEPSVPAELLTLCRWIADYYLTPLGVVLRAALPNLLSQVRRSTLPVQTRRVLCITRELPSLLERDQLFGRARRQRECYEVLESLRGRAEVAHLTGRLHFSSSVLEGLVAKGLARFDEAIVARDPFADTDVPPVQRHRPTGAQQAAIGALRQALLADVPAGASSVGGASAAPGAGRRHPFLLHGVTGSGKTLVYIELLREALDSGRGGAIVLVPEISLTPQTVARFRAEFGDTVAVLHSALSDGERYDAWRALHSGQRSIAIGARSAIFAPVRNLAAIIVDEEHEGSYKQSEAPRYHAREVAVVRARLAGAVCVLGSATPSIESWHNAQTGKYRLLALPDRVEGRPLPPVRVVDLRTAGARSPDGTAAGDQRRRPVLSPDLVAAVRDRMDRREQVILLLNRRGYASFVQCRACGVVWHCQACNVSLTYHRFRRRLVCHYCFHEEPTPVSCDACGSGDIALRGAGTEQVEREVVETFPTARVVRMDVDTTSAKWAHHEILARVERHEVDILLGTQMIAKGLDFPDVTLVGVVNADVAMNLPDFRAGERTFQLLTQVAGRAGRGARGGEVIIQTSLPGHYAIRCAVTHDFASFARTEIAERQGPPYPPFVRMVNVVVSGTAEEPVADAARLAADWLEQRLEGPTGAAAVTLTGPAPCPIDRIRGRWRWHFLLRSPGARALSRVCRLFQQQYQVSPGRAELRFITDRDPVSLL